MRGVKRRLQVKKRRANRVRSKIRGTKEIPRLSIFRSNRGLYAQIIDDTKGVTLASSLSKSVKPAKDEKLTTKAKIAYALGEAIAEKAKTAKVKKVIFDRGPYKYHGRVKAFVEGVRKGGLEV